MTIDPEPNIILTWARVQIMHATRWRLLLSILLMWGASGMFWMGIALGYSRWKPNMQPNSHLYLAIADRHPRTPDSTLDNQFTSDAIIATHEEKLIEDAGDIKELKAEAKLIHDQIASLQDRLVLANNALNDRLNVDEAKTSTALWVVGLLFGGIQVIPILLSVAEFKQKLKAATKHTA